MLFARVTSFFFAALTFGLLVSASPVADAEKRAVSAETIVSNLQTTVNGIMPQLQGMKTNTAANSAKAEALVNQLISAIDNANTQAQFASLEKREETTAAVAAVLSGVVSDVGEVLAPVIIIFPILGPLIVGIDVALNSLILSLDFVVFGLVGTLNGLLFGVAGILRGLGLTVLLLTLGL